MVDINKALEDYKKECENATPAERAEALKKVNETLKDTGLYVNPDKNNVKPSEVALVCEDIKKINGYALLDTGTGSLDKVLIENGKLVDCNCGDMFALVKIGDILFEVVNGTELIKH